MNRSTIIQVTTNGVLSLLKVLDTSTRPSLRLNSLDWCLVLIKLVIITRSNSFTLLVLLGLIVIS